MVIPQTLYVPAASSLTSCLVPIKVTIMHLIVQILMVFLFYFFFRYVCIFNSIYIERKLQTYSVSV
jgi:hypothetical protein